MADMEMRLSNGEPYTRTNHQIRALLRKNVVLQLRQKKTNCCQIGFPVFFMVLLGVLTLAYSNVLPEGTITYEPPSRFNAANVTLPCSAANATVNAVNGTYGTNGTLGGEVCGTFDHLYFAEADGVDAGELTNSTEVSANKTGLLGRIRQHDYIYPDSYQGGGYIQAPFFEELASSDDIDNELFLLLTQQAEDIEVMWSMPTGVVIFNELVTNSSAPVIDYILQMKEQPFGPDTHTDDDDYSSAYPPVTNWFSQARVAQYLSYIHGGLLSEALGLAEDGVQVTITTSTESMVQQIFPYVYPMAAVGGCSVIPFALGFLLPVYVYLLVLEKSEKHLEMMRIMGMKKYTYWGVNTLFFLSLYVIVALVVIALGFAFQLQIFYDTNPVVYLFHFFLWGILQVSFAFFLSTLFQNPKTGSIVSYLMVFLGIGFSYEISLFLVGPQPTGISYYIYLLFPTFPMVRGVYLMEHPFFVPQFLSPYSWDVFIDFTDPLMVCWYFMIAEIILCFVLTLYLDKVMPRAYGVQQPPLFPIYWIIEKLKQLQGKGASEKDKEVAQYAEFKTTEEMSNLRGLTNEKGEVVREEDEDCFAERERAIDPESDCLLRIVDMNKVYKSTKRKGTDKWALRGLSFTVNNNECFGLLGPNGAGKTTLQSILCGLLHPTKGYAMLAGRRIPEETEAVYTMIGYCPQHDVLWDDLTIEEHLLFYVRLKGIPSKFEKEEVQRLIERVQLEKSASKRASELSGGMKRRLSVAIALIGDPRFVLLDEPTTGVDPVNRRAIWDILSREKEGRCLILTTHNMEEADVLCNRIGIMARGQLICIGSQAHLKKKFGTGFTVQVMSDDHHKSHDFILSIFPTAVQDMDSSMSGLLCYRIPQNTELDLVGLFTAMKDRALYGIKEWSIQQTTLEEVFLKVFEFEEAATD